jgi:hypothetical protein
MQTKLQAFGMTQEFFPMVWLFASKTKPTLPVVPCPRITVPLLAQYTFEVGSNVSSSV